MNSTKTSKVPKRNQYITVYYLPARFFLFQAFFWPQFQLPKDGEVVSPTTTMPRRRMPLKHAVERSSEIISQDVPTDHTLWLLRIGIPLVIFRSFKRKSQKLISWNWGYEWPLWLPLPSFLDAFAQLQSIQHRSTPPFIGNVPLPCLMTQKVTAPKIEMPESSITQSLPGDSPSRS